MAISRRVLIIDDDPDFCAAIGSLLESAGYEVKREGSGPDGLRTARAFQPDLIVLDVMMAERTEGFFVLQEIRRTPSLRNKPVIVASSMYGDHPFFRVDPNAGWLPADLFLPKPIEPSHLLNEAERLIASTPSPAPSTVAAEREV